MSTETPIDSYLNTLPPEKKAVLVQLRKQIKEALPTAEELITYQIPTFKFNGKAVIGFAAYKNHFSIFPFGGGILKHFKDELAGFEQTKGSLHFTAQNPVPKALLVKIIDFKLTGIKS